MFCCLQSPKGTVTNQQVKEKGRSWFVCFFPQRPPAGNPLPNSNLSKLSSLELNVCPNPSKRLKCPPNSRSSLILENPPTTPPSWTPLAPAPARLPWSPSAGTDRPSVGRPFSRATRPLLPSAARHARSAARPPAPRERDQLGLQSHARGVTSPPPPGLLSPGQRPATPPADKG